MDMAMVMAMDRKTGQRMDMTPEDIGLAMVMDDLSHTCMRSTMPLVCLPSESQWRKADSTNWL